MAMFFLTLDIMVIYYKARKNYNTYGGDDYGVLGSLQDTHSQKSIMVFVMFRVNFDSSFTHCCQRSYGVSHYAIEECPN
jgi:hypothetical protein